MPRAKIFSMLSIKQDNLKKRMQAIEGRSDDAAREEWNHLIRTGQAKRPKDMCPSCLKVHTQDERPPDTCYAIAGSDGKALQEFDAYLRANRFGRIQ